MSIEISSHSINTPINTTHAPITANIETRSQIIDINLKRNMEDALNEILEDLHMTQEEKVAFKTEFNTLTDYLQGNAKRIRNHAADFIKDMIGRFDENQNNAPENNAPESHGINANNDIFDNLALLISNIVEEIIGPNNHLLGLFAYELRQILIANEDTIVPVSRIWRVTEHDAEKHAECVYDMTAYAKELIAYWESLGFPNVIREENLIPIDYVLSEDNNLMTTLSSLEDEDEIFRAIKSKINEGDEGRLIAFINTFTIERIARLMKLKTDRSVSVTESMNNKGQFLAALSKNGVSSPINIRIQSLVQAFIAACMIQYKVTGKIDINADMGARLKFNRGASGYGNLAESTLLQLLKVLVKKNAYLHEVKNGHGASIMEWVEFDESPGVLLHIGRSPHADRVLGIAEQVLKETVYVGSLGCTNIDLLEEKYPGIKEYIQNLCNALRQQGSFGFQGIDLVVKNNKNEENGENTLEIKAIENNCRLTGQTHVAYIASKLGFEFYGVHNSVVVPKNMPLQEFINLLQKQNIHYEPHKGGIFVTNHSNARNGRMMIGILARNKGDLDRFFQEVMEISKKYASNPETTTPENQVDNCINITREELLSLINIK